MPRATPLFRRTLTTYLHYSRSVALLPGLVFAGGAVVIRPRRATTVSRGGQVQQREPPLQLRAMIVPCIHERRGKRILRTSPFGDSRKFVTGRRRIYRRSPTGRPPGFLTVLSTRSRPSQAKPPPWRPPSPQPISATSHARSAQQPPH